MCDCFFVVVVLFRFFFFFFCLVCLIVCFLWASCQVKNYKVQNELLELYITNSSGKKVS